MDVRPEIVEGKPNRGGLRSLVWVVLFALLLFVPAGTMHWPGAWVYLALLAASSVWGLRWLGRHDPGLLAERLRSPIQRGQLPADKLLMVAFVPLWFGWFVLMRVPGLSKNLKSPIAVWSEPVVWIIAGELALSALCLGLTFYFQSRKTSFV